MKYRAEIDGLRTLAVVPVILFHAGFDVFSGGFVGVDIFFVISGYLITTILINDLEAGRFSIVNFYERRARRILPALFLVMLVCLPFAWLLLLPPDLKDFSASLISVVTFVSNILFWQQSGYFDTAAELKPLLHTWSLAVEEQYYIFFPVLLFLLWRMGRRVVTAALAVLFLASLALAQWGVVYKPSAAFFLLPTRTWELLVGSFCAVYLTRHPMPARSPLTEALSLLGIAMIAASVVFFGPETPTPGLYALVPTLGTALIVFFARPETLSGRFLGNRVLVGIGLVSYSAYLWHQPIFAFARQTGGEPAAWIMLLLSALAIGLAYLSWKYVEAPFRNRERFDRKRIFLLSLAGIVFFAAVGAAGVHWNGFESRLTGPQKELLAYRNYPRAELYREGACFLRPDQPVEEIDVSCYDGARTMVWGDSHAAALTSGLRGIRDGVGQITASACPPLLGYAPPSRPHCAAINAFALEQIARTRPDQVVLFANWQGYAPFVEAHLAETLAALKQTGVEDILVLGGAPDFPPGLPERMLQQRLDLSGPSEIVADIGPIARLDTEIERIAQAQGIPFEPLLDRLCDGDHCRATVTDKTGAVVPMSWDRSHFTQPGAQFVAEQVFGQ
ncbi:acyltransferase family protein [Chachezhania sediminis]|uniref:acyltransferase family protein n=1 Tax=Chachezhania sediminis TaxID=2599291 RepID=UPI00131AE955|nr:acyltransferase family protein [Chachezhania sediminis]